MPQLLIVEMLLEDASGKLYNGQLEVACHMIGQAACIMDKVALPAPQALDAVPVLDLAPVVPMATALEIPAERPRTMAAAA